MRNQCDAFAINQKRLLKDVERQDLAVESLPRAEFLKRSQPYAFFKCDSHDAPTTVEIVFAIRSVSLRALFSFRRHLWGARQMAANGALKHQANHRRARYPAWPRTHGRTVRSTVYTERLVPNLA